jgi:RHS repeat-associated protein
MLAGTAVMGKALGPVEGDCFDQFVADLTPSQMKAFFDADDPYALASEHLGTATTRILYDLERVPMCAASIARETHVSDLAPGGRSKVQLHFVYSDGYGREAQSKIQAEPGPLNADHPGSPVVDPRWVGSGAKIYNNKGKPVREYEPFFSATPHFGIEKWGVSNTLFYDPVLRVVATLHPNNTYEKVVFDPWQQITFDVNDTVTFDPKTDQDVGEYFIRLPDSDYLPTWYQQRIDGARGPHERAAAIKAAKDAGTPTVADFDSLGRPVLTVADNGNGQYFRTRSVIDIEGNQRAVIDALDRVVMRYDYDMLSTRIHQASMEAGERWMLNDATGKPIRAWNSRLYVFRTEYDELHRPLKSFVQGGDSSELNAKVYPQEILFAQTIYGDSPDTGLTEFQQQQANLRGKVYRHFDSAGVITTDLYDFKGNSLRSTRKLASDYKNVPDWLQHSKLDIEYFPSTTRYDALNRAISVTAPDNSIYRPAFNQANFLEKVDVNLRGARTNGQLVWTPFVTHINYDAKGQRTIIRYANGASTSYQYDPDTFRLIHLKTTRSASQNGLAARLFRHASTVQDLHYTYDPVGNITRIEDAALQTVFNANQQVDPACEYTYDPLYRLIAATGREQIGQSAFEFAPPNGNDRDYPFAGAADLDNLQALRSYTEHYDYDPVGNFEKMLHRAAHGNWTRVYAYDEASLIEPFKNSNRLSLTALQTHGILPVEPYRYDAHGNITQMPHLPLMQWNFKDELSATSQQVVNRGVPETTYYIYDASGQRVRKITEGQNGVKKNDRLYLGGFEVYREYGSGSDVTRERETLHVMDDRQRIALVETLTIDHGVSIPFPNPALRYHLANHLGSACLELDPAGSLISYEEYSPYGTTTYQAGTSAAEVSLKRYRYTGKERDEENGFTYHGARYYAPWLARWTSSDPAALQDATNLYLYVRCNPVKLTDPTGALSWLEEKLDSVVNPQNSVAKAVMDNLAKRGEALVNAPSAINEVYQREGAVGVATSVAKGLGHLVKDTGEALGDVAYTGSHLDEPGAKEKLATRSVDAVLGVADIVTIFDGAGAAKGAGTGAISAAKDVAATVKVGTKSLKGLEPALQTASGVVKTGGKAAVAAGDPAIALAQGAKATGILMMESKNVGSASSPQVTKIPEGQSGTNPPTPTRVKPSTVTAKPKGGTAATTFNKSALADLGMAARDAFITFDEQHHLLVQQFEKWFASKGINIHDYSVTLTWGEHSAVHSMGWNKTWSEWINANKGASAEVILNKMNEMRKQFGLEGNPVHPYKR